MRYLASLLNGVFPKRGEYVVSFVDCKDEYDTPITVSIMVDRTDIKAFENFLKREEGNIFRHAKGGSVEY